MFHPTSAVCVLSVSASVLSVSAYINSLCVVGFNLCVVYCVFQPTSAANVLCVSACLLCVSSLHQQSVCCVFQPVCCVFQPVCCVFQPTPAACVLCVSASVLCVSTCLLCFSLHQQPVCCVFQPVCCVFQPVCCVFQPVCCVFQPTPAACVLCVSACVLCISACMLCVSTCMLCASADINSLCVACFNLCVVCFTLHQQPVCFSLYVIISSLCYSLCVVCFSLHQQPVYCLFQPVCCLFQSTPAACFSLCVVCFSLHQQPVYCLFQPVCCLFQSTSAACVLPVSACVLSVSAYISNLCAESKAEAVSCLLSCLPLLQAGNVEAKEQYLKIIPKILAHSLEKGCHIEESRQLLSYTLIHPAISADERTQLKLWQRYLEECYAPVIPHQQWTSDANDTTPSYVNNNGHQRVPPVSNGISMFSSPPMQPATVGCNSLHQMSLASSDSGVLLQDPDTRAALVGSMASTGAWTNVVGSEGMKTEENNFANGIMLGHHKHLPLHATYSGPPALTPPTSGECH